MDTSLTLPAVRAQIIAAFAGVELEDGVGLLEARGLDDHAGEVELRSLHAQDQREDWAAIPASVLQTYQDTLSFFDSKGMRFHLPAFMIAHLDGLTDGIAIYHLTHVSDWSRSLYSALSLPQRLAVRAYLSLLLERPECEFDHEDIRTGLRDPLWKIEPNQQPEPMRAKGPHGSS